MVMLTADASQRYLLPQKRRQRCKRTAADRGKHVSAVCGHAAKGQAHAFQRDLLAAERKIAFRMVCWIVDKH